MDTREPIDDLREATSSMVSSAAFAALACRSGPARRAILETTLELIA